MAVEMMSKVWLASMVVDCRHFTSGILGRKRHHGTLSTHRSVAGVQYTSHPWHYFLALPPRRQGTRLDLYASMSTTAIPVRLHLDAGEHRQIRCARALHRSS